MTTAYLRWSALLGLLVLGSPGSQAEQAAAVKQQLLENLHTSEARMIAARANQGLIEVRQPGMAFGSVRGFDAAEVEKAVATVRSELVSGLGTNELAGLRAYAEEFFPDPQLRTLQFTATPETTCTPAPCPSRLAEAASVQTAYAQTHGFVQKVAYASAYKTSFRVRSKPSGARFVLQPLGGGLTTETATDGSVGEMYRGLYRYTIERSGYKKASATLNLVDNDPAELFCELVATNSASDPLPCLFGVID